MKEQTQIDLMNELVEDSVEILKELLEEEIKPLLNYRKETEQKIANKEIAEMRKIEEEL